MKNILIVVVALVVAVGVYFLYARDTAPTPTPAVPTPTAAIEVVAVGLSIPWDIAFLPNGSMLVTERTGHVIEILRDGTQSEIQVGGVRQGGEGGLLGLVLHPNFANNRFVYLYMSAPSAGGETQNRVVRYTFSSGELVEDKVIIDSIPGAIYHDGGRMEFGPDNMLYITTGDATRSQIAQDKNSLGGKILRLHDDGRIPTDNPFGSAVWSMGHRNPQGLAWDSAGNLWESEHGRSGARSGLDEINQVVKGANYGWPTIEGDTTQDGLVAPALHSGASTTWAPASLAYLNGKLYFGGLMGEALYEVTVDGTSVRDLRAHLKNEFGRIRTVRVGPNNMLYITTSNKDGRGNPAADDDKIIRVDPAQLH